MMSTLLLDSNSYRLGKFRFQISEKPAFFKHVTPLPQQQHGDTPKELPRNPNQYGLT